MAFCILSLAAQHYQQQRSVEKVDLNKIRHVYKVDPCIRLNNVPNDLPKIIFTKSPVQVKFGASNSQPFRKSRTYNPNYITAILNKNGHKNISINN